MLKLFKTLLPSKRKQVEKPSSLSHGKNAEKSKSVNFPKTFSFNDICVCAYLGQKREIDCFLKKNRSLLNKQDKDGLTLLHYAVLGKKIRMIRYLIGQGANLNVSDYDGFLPIFYAGKHSIIKDILRKNGSFKHDDSMAEIHHVVREGNLKRLQTILEKKPGEIEIKDSSGWSPLFYAVMAQSIPAIKFLVKKGANVDLTDDLQCNLIDYAKENRKHNDLSKFLKKMMGLDPQKLILFKKSCQEYLEEELKCARALNKKILIVLGESHGDFKVYQLQKIIITLAKLYGIEWAYTENKKKRPCEFPIDFFARDNLSMFVVGVDNPSNRKNATMEERNEVISKAISDIDKAGVLLVGSRHLYGLLKEKSSQIDKNKFHVVAFNLASIIKDSQYDECFDSVFAYHDKSVIQVKETSQAIVLITSEDIHPVTSEDIHPVTSEDIHPVTSEDIHPVTSKDIHPVTSEDIHPVTSEDIHPVTSEDIHPKANKNKNSTPRRYI
ncbi:MAG: ankyrin repeat domain-containing protein [Gammaproteobacteria bacterium]|nr:ankyrin repeat domain-containing protein [Gammaproteobacteria bacterium]